LDELRLGLTDAWIDARLAAGDDPAAIVGDAGRAAAGAPLRESTQALWIRALARAGRQADALRAAHEFRQGLAEGTGLDPSSAFVDLETEVALGYLTPPTAVPDAPGGLRIGRPAAPMIGREHESIRLRDLIARQRLVTVVGPGGVGKTRLALGTAAEASETGRPAVLVELATVEDPRNIVDALATALRLRASSSSGVADTVRDALATGTPLLVLDNCEHVIDTVRDLVDHLLSGTMGLTILATSREPLGVPGEHVLPLGPLTVPGEATEAHELATVPAVAAFLVHAREHAAVDLDALDGEPMRRVADVVRRLDGLPLALELAAGRLRTLSLGDLHDRLDRALDLLAAGFVGRRPSSDAARHDRMVLPCTRSRRAQPALRARRLPRRPRSRDDRALGSPARAVDRTDRGGGTSGRHLGAAHRAARRRRALSGTGDRSFLCAERTRGPRPERRDRRPRYRA
jgi:RecA/RadA recombinase